MPRDEFKEILSGIFALIVLVIFSGTILKSLPMDNLLSASISIILLLGLAGIVIGIIKKLREMFF